MSQWQKRMRPLLGCYVEIGLPASATAAQFAFNQAFARIELIHNLLSFHQLASDLSRINSAQGGAVICHPLSIQCLRLARATMRASQGHFNCTLGAALIAAKALPQHDYPNLYPEQLLAHGDWQDIVIDKSSVRLRRPVLLSLDGIAKGFAVDSAIAELKKAGIAQGWINAGGDMRVFGELILPVTVRDHLRAEHALGGLQDAAIATSTSAASPEYPGLLLDFSGSAVSAMTSTVIARRAWRADALTKVAASVPPSQRAAIIARLGGRWIPIDNGAASH